MGYGFASHVGLARETTWGTPVAVASGDFFPAMSDGLALAIDRFVVRNIAGMAANPDDMAGARRIEGEISAMGHPVTLGHFLRGLTNSGSITVVLSGFLWTHDYFTRPIADASTLAPLPSYTTENFRDVTSSNRYAGLQMARGTFGFQPNQDLRATLGLVGKTTSVIAKGTPTYPGSSVDPFAWDQVSVSIAGAATPKVEAFTFSIDNQVEAIYSGNNSVEPAYMRYRGPQLTAFTATMDFSDLVEYNAFVNQTEQRLVISLFRANSFSMSFDMPRAFYRAFPLTVPGRERLTVAVDGEARYHVGSATAFQIKLTTVKSNY